MGAKTAKATACDSNMRLPQIGLMVETAGQHCLLFNLA